MANYNTLQALVHTYSPHFVSFLDEEQWELSGSSTLDTVGRRLRSKNLDTTGFLQQQMIGELYTPYRIWHHHFRLKRRGHQPK
jgi:hypothetical protein